MEQLPEINERIRQIMEQKKLSPSSFADAVDVSRPVISHILSGRNKPGLDLLQKVVEIFTDVNPRWLLTGKGTKAQEHPPAPEKPAQRPANHAAREEDAAPYFTGAPSGEGESAPKYAPQEPVKPVSPQTHAENRSASTPEQIILLFPDGSFRMFHT
ncbi:MAG: helix-turn-helix transcriptional regulator [Bacteroidia bacterium]